MATQRIQFAANDEICLSFRQQGFGICHRHVNDETCALSDSAYCLIARLEFRSFSAVKLLKNKVLLPTYLAAEWKATLVYYRVLTDMSLKIATRAGLLSNCSSLLSQSWQQKVVTKVVFLNLCYQQNFSLTPSDNSFSLYELIEINNSPEGRVKVIIVWEGSDE